MQSKLVMWGIFISFISFTMLQLLNLFNFIGNEYDLLTQLVSTISLVLIGIFTGIVVLKKQISSKNALLGMIFVIFGIALIPIITLISVTVLNSLLLSMEIKLVATWILSVSFGLIYMSFLIWYRKKLHPTNTWEDE